MPRGLYEKISLSLQQNKRIMAGEKIWSEKNRWSTGVILITFISLLFIIGGVVFILLSHAPSVVLQWGIAGVIIVPVLWVATWTPISLSLRGDQLVMKQLIGGITIPVDTIENIQPIDSTWLKGSIRLFGSGGLFGFLGRFRNSTLGRYTMYVTAQKNLLLIQTPDKTYVFNARQSAELIALVKKSKRV
jgi:hypothetical protein